MLSALKHFISKHEASGSRSSVLNPISWLIVLFLLAVLACWFFRLPDWLGVIFLVVIGVLLILYIFSYIFCLFTDKDALRSERYSLQKYAIEKGIVGDNLEGIIESEGDKRKLLDSPTSNEESGGDQ